ncbi:pyridine nucleotide-disulfide oxidoreductase [Thermotoga sp. Ku-13t]|nr:pyridine nucleotide-disulfide oxidoreductase [Thermotoga sp. Ku-13t]
MGGETLRRIVEHPILKAKTARVVKFYFEDKELEALEGETIAAALIANGIDVFGKSERGRPRGFFCAIGKCSSCLMLVDGEPNVRVCITLVKEGMRVQRQLGRSDVA